MMVAGARFLQFAEGLRGIAFGEEVRLVLNVTCNIQYI